MSASIDPSKTFTYVLAEDRQKPEAEQRKLFFRYCSARESDKIDALFEQGKKEDTYKSEIEAIRIALAGWEGFELPYNPDDIDAVLSRADFHELRGQLTYEMTLSSTKKKNAASQSPSTAESSAK